MEGNAPLKGDPKHVGLIIAGRNALACERVCCRLFNWDEEDIFFLKTARKLYSDYPDLNNIMTFGDAIDIHCVPQLAQPEKIPLRFTFKQVCRSIIVQAGMLGKSFFKPGRKKPQTS